MAGEADPNNNLEPFRYFEYAAEVTNRPIPRFALQFEFPLG